MSTGASSLPNFSGVFARRLVFLFTFGLHASLFHTHATRVLLADATLVLYPLSTRSLKVKMLHSLFFVVADLHASAYNSYRAFLLTLLAPPIFVVTRLVARLVGVGSSSSLSSSVVVVLVVSSFLSLSSSSSSVLVVVSSFFFLLQEVKLSIKVVSY